MTDKAGPSSAPIYHLSNPAYTIPLLHAAKHLSSTVIGVFIGKSDTSNPSNIIIEYAIPLIHHYTSLTPMTELALEMVEVYAKEQGKRIVGMYEVGQGESTLSRSGERLLRALREGREGMFALTVDEKKLGEGEWPYITYMAPENSNIALKPITSSSQFQLSSTDLPRRALSGIRQYRIHQDLGDFDDHLENTCSSIDWLKNPSVKQAVKTYLA